MSTCDSIPHSPFSLHQPSRNVAYLDTCRRGLSCNQPVRKAGPVSVRASSRYPQFETALPVGSDGKHPLTLDPPPSITGADMERRSRQDRVTLPPLSSLTASIDLGYRRDQPPVHEPNAALRSRPSDPRAVSMMDLDRRDEAFAPPPRPEYHHASESRRQSADFSPSHRPYSGLPSSSVASSSRREAPTSSVSPRPSKAPMRAVAESNRPRAYSSPHRPIVQNFTRRSSLADAAEVDRLLEGLLYVQDINRRLGLRVGSPASPSIFHSSRAAQMLNEKLLDELDTMAYFSQGRAESVAEHLGLSAYRPSRRDPRNVGSSREGGLIAPPLPSGQPDHSSWAPNLSRHQHPHPEFEYARPTESDERDHRQVRSRLSAGAHDTYATQTEYANPSLRAASRAVSLEYPPSHPPRHQHSHHLERDPREPHRFDAAARMPPVPAAQYPYGHSGMPPAYYGDGQHQQQMELLDRRRLAGKGMKRVRKRKNEHHQECLGCQAKETPEWRKGPMGPRTLCNACGLLYAKLTKRKQQEAEAAAKASGKTAEEIVREREESPGAKQASLEALRAELNLVNGMRNRPSSSSAPLSDAHMLDAPYATPGQSRYYDEGPSQPWPAGYDDAQPFAHQPPSHRMSSVDPARSNSPGHTDSLHQLPVRPMEAPRQPSLRPYTGSAGSGSQAMFHPGRQRSSTLQHPATHGFASSSEAQRRHHPYM